MDSKLITICKLVLVVVALMFSDSASAMPGMRIDTQKMEANVGCVNCAAHAVNKLGGERAQAQVEGLLQNIAMVGSDNRRPQPRTGSGKVFAPIGGIVPNQPILATYFDKSLKKTVTKKIEDAESTAFLVSPCYIVTTYHSVFGDERKPDLKKFSATFYVGQGKNGEPFEERAFAVPVAHGPHDPAVKDPSTDWALLKVASCPGERVGWLEMEEVSAKEPNRNGPYSMAGYPADKPADTLWMEDKCATLQPQDVHWRFHCDLMGAGSGSPIFYMKNGIPTVVAMATSDSGVDRIAENQRDKLANFAADTSFILNGIKGYLVKDRQRMVNPLLTLTTANKGHSL